MKSKVCKPFGKIAKLAAGALALFFALLLSACLEGQKQEGDSPPKAELSADWDALLEEVFFPSKPIDGSLPPGAGQIRPPALSQLISGQELDIEEQAMLAGAWKPACEGALQLTKAHWKKLQGDLRQLRPLLRKKWSGPQFVHRAEVMCARAWYLFGRGEKDSALSIYRAVLILGQIAERGVPAVTQFTGLAAVRIALRVKDFALNHLHVLLAREKLSSAEARSIATMLANIEHSEAPFTIFLTAKERQAHGIKLPAAGELGFHRKLTELPFGNIEGCLNVWLKSRTKSRGLRILADLKATGKKPHQYLMIFHKQKDLYPKDPAVNKDFCISYTNDTLRLYGRGLDGKDNGGTAKADVVLLPLKP